MFNQVPLYTFRSKYGLLIARLSAANNIFVILVASNAHGSCARTYSVGHVASTNASLVRAIKSRWSQAVISY